jgi:PAS domain S-box-containing protein
MDGPCRVLVVEDSATDYELIVRELRKSEFNIVTMRVMSEPDFLAALDSFSPHLICTDFRLPGFNGLDILHVAQEHSGVLPVIVVTGSLTEEDAADSIKAGATDYVVKERLFRLVPAVRSALEKRREREALQETQRRFEHSESRALALLNATSDGVALLARDGMVLEANRPFADSMGQDVDGILGSRVWDATPGDQAANLQNLLERVFTTGNPVRSEVSHGELWLDLTLYPVRSAEGTIDRVALFRRDITQQKHNQAELERLWQAVSQADESFVVTDADGEILYVNPAFEEITGYTAAEAIGQRPNLLKSGKHEDSFYESMWRTIRSGKTWKGRFTNRRKDGEFYQEDATISPVTDAEGTISNYVAVSRDVTQQLRMEERMVRQERLQALGKMVSGIAHDFNNLMTPILGLSEELLTSPESMAQPECVRACLSQIVSSAKDARDIVRRLREFDRPGEEVKRHPVDILDIANRAIALTKPAWETQAQAMGRTLVVRNEIGTVPPVLGNASQLRELLINLLLNATDAIPQSGEIVIQAEARAPRLFLRVRDTGIGMDEEQVSRCLEPFYSTKGERGSGLGLSMCYGIVKQHGGDLQIQSSPGQGTTVEVVLPVCREETAPAAEDPQFPPDNVEGTLRILVVDDEPMALKVMQKLFERLGHDVTASLSGPKALDKLGDGQYHLLVTDRAMPGMSGDEVAARAKEMRPRLPVIMLTGFGELMNYAGESPPGVDLVVGKPASLKDLSDAIQRVME